MKRFFKLIVVLVLLIVFLCIVMALLRTGTERYESRPTPMSSETPIPRRSPTPKIYETKTKVFAGQTPGEALVEWKEAFPEWTVVKWEIGLDAEGNPVELKIWYTK